MNNSSLQSRASDLQLEKSSEKLLMEKMGLSRKEMKLVVELYGVSASRLVEIMQLSKYAFVHSDQQAGSCQPCGPLSAVRVMNF